EKYAIAEKDVVAEIAEERRPDHDVRAGAAKVLREQCVALGRRKRHRCVVAREPCAVRALLGLYLRVARAIRFAREHFLLFRFQVISPSFGNASGTAASRAMARAASSSI